MKIINAGYEILFLSDPRLIERMGRIAYKSEDKITGTSHHDFIRMIAKRGHESVLEHSLLSVLLTTDRGVSHEIVRHRLASYTQESTRYCNYSSDKFGNSITVIRPSWMNERAVGEWPNADFPFADNREHAWLMAMADAERAYLEMLADGCTAQEARAVLPNSLKTEIGVSANFREWRHFFQLRAISKAAHPDMRRLVIPLYERLRAEFPEIFDLGNVE